MIKSFIFSLAVTLICLTASVGYSQKPNQDTYWLGVGLGKTQFPSGMIAVGYEFSNRPTLLIARYSLNAELMQAPEPGIKANELGLLYGLKVGKFRFSTGLSGVWGNNRGKYLFTDPDPFWGSGEYYEFVKYKTIGIPGEVRFITSGKNVGIGITGFGNWNAKRSFVGLNLSLYLGKIK